MRCSPDDNEVVVRTEIRGRGDPIQLDYRLEKAGGGWKIYDVNVLGVWLVENYRNSFAQEIGANGIDGLIAKLAERNKSAGARQELRRRCCCCPRRSRCARRATRLRMLAQALQREGTAGPVVVDASALRSFDSTRAGGAARMPAPGARLGPRLRGAAGAGASSPPGAALRRRAAAAAEGRLIRYCSSDQA